MGVQLSARVRNARADSVETTIGTSPILKIRSGSAPADCATADVQDGIAAGKAVSVRVSGGDSEEADGYPLAVRVTLSNGRTLVNPAVVVVVDDY